MRQGAPARVVDWCNGHSCVRVEELVRQQQQRVQQEPQWRWQLSWAAVGMAACCGAVVSVLLLR